ncbi:MAG: iron-containing alcohol dehydrogenase [Deltaproteobacteria bacterium]|nr:iron-containing alcohol dehydrogenase [Deltaproteobacteria bacterium]
MNMSYKDRLNFNFHIPTRIVFGEGALKETVKEMDSLGMRQALVVTDVTLKDTPMVKSLLDHLGNKAASLYAEAIPDSSVEVVNRGAQVFCEARADGLISIGGGSTMDTTKAIGVLAKKGKNDLKEFLGFSKVGEPIVPHIAIPTTSGTASEVTMFATIKDHETKIKNLMSDPFLIPRVAILDPLLTVGLPPVMTAATGMDAMSHAVESFHARGYEPIADGLALQAIRLIVQYLPRCLEKGDDVEARGMQAIASTMAGMAFQNALVGCVHGMAHALGGMYGLHHGLANAILLSHGIRFNMPVSAHRYRQVGEALGLDPGGKNDAEIGEMAARAIENFTRQLGLPQRLSQVNIPKDNLGEVAKLAVVDPGMRSNIRKVTDPQEITAVLLAAW